MNQDEVRGHLERAVQRLLDRDRELLARDVNERSITHRLAMYLQDEFPDMDVDCEYNRRDFDVKRLGFYPRDTATNDTDARTVFPDIIVHKRGTNAHNLLVIEAKKSGNQGRNNQNTDRRKLQAFKSDADLRYEHAVFLQFRTGETAGAEGPEFILDATSRPRTGGTS